MVDRVRLRTEFAVVIVAVLATLGYMATSQAQEGGPDTGVIPQYQALMEQYCTFCHSSRVNIGGHAFDQVDLGNIHQHADVLEKAAVKIRSGSMPPAGLPRPDPQSYFGFAEWLEGQLDHAAVENPDPGRPALYRLNRTEYATVIRDLLSLDIDVAALLPPDTTSYGFDNIADVLGVSAALLEGYLAAADRVSAIAVGDEEFAPEMAIYDAGARLSQDKHMEGLPLGTRGGIAIEHNFPLDGVYEIHTAFRGNSLYAVRGLLFSHKFELSVDGRPARTAIIGGPADYNHMQENADASRLAIERRAHVRVPVTAGVHRVIATFYEKTGALEVDQLEPFELIDFDPVYVGNVPSVMSVSIRGPYNGKAPLGDTTASRKEIFSCRPTSSRDERRCAESILSRLARKAYRQPLLDSDVDELMDFYTLGREQKGTFEGGVQMGLRRILASPEFVFRFERDPVDVEPGEAFQISDLELASRLSFFLWSSIPDEELVGLASRGRLSNPRVLEAQVLRMLADPRSRALVENFAGQWLHLRRLESVEPDIFAFPDFDDNLRQAFKQETSLFFESVMREDRSVLDLMRADYTYMNDRLARHYGVQGVLGSAFQRVSVTDEARRGLLGHGSILTVTSFAHRTSPVVRGKWVLENLIGGPPPMPPDDVPALVENQKDSLDHESFRARLERHRDDPACSACHNVMDSIGFALEPFDGIGAWRVRDEAGEPVDASGRLANGMAIDGPVELREALIEDPSQFVRTFVEKLMIYGLGRGLEYYDMPKVRKVEEEAAKQDYRFSSIIFGIVASEPFQMKRAANEDGMIRASL